MMLELNMALNGQFDSGIQSWYPGKILSYLMKEKRYFKTQVSETMGAAILK